MKNNYLGGNIISYMNFSKLTFLLFLFFGISASLFSQNESWFFIRAKSENFNPIFEKADNHLVYKGKDHKLKRIFSTYTISEFKKTYKNANKLSLKRTFFVVVNDEKLLEDLLLNASEYFDFGEIVKEVDKKIFEPNDYGLTSTITENKGLEVNLDYFDFIGAPQAWYYTTGSKDMIIGLSDGQVEITNKDFSDKTTVINESTKSKGHGSGVASIAAGQGDNGYGVPGICYDCSIYATTYNNHKTLKQLKELSEMGVKVINCSWATTASYQTAQDVIDEIFENGTIIVSAAGNLNWSKSKGKVLYFPSSYKNVISVASGMHRYSTVEENTMISKKGNPYAANIKNYVGRTIGFKDNDTSKKHHIWPVSITTLNPEVDLLAPSVDLFRYSQFATLGKEMYTMEASSSTAPFVTGTIGLMLSLNPCLPIDEVETILKFTATNIDDIEANRPYKGNYGAGSLHTGRAVKMVYDLYTETETATIENQKFSRWNFKLTSLSEKVLMQNQQFTEAVVFELKAKNKIVIGKNTIIKPNKSGSIVLKIDPTLEKECDLVLREGFPNNKYYHPNN
jgi:subtilisin family serine protease